MKVANRATRLLLWLREREPLLLLSVLLLIAVTWGFAEIADEVMEGETQAFDKWVVRGMRQADDPAVPIGPGWLQELGRDATALGGLGAVSLFTVVVSGYLWLDKKPRLAVFLIAASVSGVVVSLGLKQLFSRPRPDIVPHLSNVHTSSFPSGHSMMSAVIYLTLGTLLAASTDRKSVKVYVIAVALAFALIVGVSRVYLGVHYPTDVLAGWMAGIVWAISCWLTARWLQRERRLKEPGSA